MLTIVNGWTGAPVAGATVTAGGTRQMSNSAGQVQFGNTGQCLTMEVVAAGFLDRRSCAVSDVTLWPIDSDAEREATRAMVFWRDRLVGSQSDSIVTPVTFAPELRANTDASDTWRSAANELTELTSRRFSFVFDDFPTERLVIGAASSLECALWPGNRPVWPVLTSLFCPEAGDDYWTRLKVMPNGLTDIRVALRALMWSMGVNPHALPGLLNQNHPANELSSFERKTMHMLGLRQVEVAWPDFDVR
jgi:hypothetical protein